jgi:tetratricopeptide (TPR) repeat protein
MESFNKGKKEIEAMNFHKAIQHFNDAIEQDSNLYFAYSFKALSLASIKDCENALICINKVLNINQNFLHGYQAKSEILMFRNNYEEALKCLHTAHKLGGDDKTTELY